MHNLKLAGSVFLSIVLCDVYGSDNEPMLFEKGVFYTVPLDPVTRQTLLHKAIIKGNFAECENLLDLKADPNARDNQDCTPLTHVTRCSRWDTAEKLRVARLLSPSGS